MLTGVRLREKVTPIAATFRAAGNVHRLAILYMLSREAMTLPVIIRRLNISPPLAAHHLGTLQRAGWVTRSKFGKLVTYYLSDTAVKEVAAIFRK